MIFCIATFTLLGRKFNSLIFFFFKHLMRTILLEISKAFENVLQRNLIMKFWKENKENWVNRIFRAYCLKSMQSYLKIPVPEHAFNLLFYIFKIIVIYRKWFTHFTRIVWHTYAFIILLYIRLVHINEL